MYLYTSQTIQLWGADDLLDGVTIQTLLDGTPSMDLPQPFLRDLARPEGELPLHATITIV